MTMSRTRGQSVGGRNRLTAPADLLGCGQRPRCEILVSIGRLVPGRGGVPSGREGLAVEPWGGPRKDVKRDTEYLSWYSGSRTNGFSILR